MKTIYSCISCIVCIVCISCIATGQVKDNFSDGNFTQNPEWAGDQGKFEVNSYGQLHLNSTGSDTSILVTRSSCVHSTEWSFWMKMSFNTSSNNHARIYLASDTPDLLSALNGYYLQAGGADDSVVIIKQTGMVNKAIYRFRLYRTFHPTNSIRVKITCDDSGNWEALIDTTGGHNYIKDGIFYDNSFTQSRWFGVMCRYTSSNSAKFYFDDFYAGPILRDTISPEIISSQAKTNQVLKISFSEAVLNSEAENPENYMVVPVDQHPDSVRQDHAFPGLVSIFLHSPLDEGTIYSLHVRSIIDLSGNRMADTIVPVFYYPAKANDILIHEIMADPDPPVGLPDGEFVELFNRSAFPVNLENWTFSYGNYSKVFPAVTIDSKDYLLIVKDSAYLNISKCAVLFTSSSSLSNEGTVLALKDPLHHVIHSVSYSPDWYRGSFKEEGGWSLEMTDPDNPCGCIENWGASTDGSGGTPGRANSNSLANPDERDPVLLRAIISDPAMLEVTFSEAMDSLSLLSVESWVVNDPDGVSCPVVVMPLPPDFSMVSLFFGKPFGKGFTYRLNIAGTMKDCAGNKCDTTRSIRFAYPDSAVLHDVAINEILSNAASGGSRFVELYNRSEKIIDLQSLVIAGKDTAGGMLPDALPMTSGGHLLFPGEYVALTANPEDICERYRPAFPELITRMNGFPVFGDDTGTIVIARKDNLAVIDRMRYDPDMHFPLLATREGVSLERTDPDQPSGERSNWHSAAETAGFATPGFQNSHCIPDGGMDDDILVQPAIFSPDNDGRDDLLFVTIHQADADFAVNISVYDSRGRLIRIIANNVLTGSENVFVWDGMTNSRSKAPLGFYVLLIELTRPDGTVRKFKKTAILGGKF